MKKILLNVLNVAKKEIKPDEFMNKLENYINSKFQKLVVKR